MKKFYPRIMRKTYPLPPVKICDNLVNRQFGIISPSRYYAYLGDPDVKAWLIEIAKYHVWKGEATISELRGVFGTIKIQHRAP